MYGKLLFILRTYIRVIFILLGSVCIISCTSKKLSSSSPKNIFSVASSYRESWISPLPGGKAGYDYYIKIAIKKECTVHFDSLLLINKESFPVKVVKGKEFYTDLNFSVLDTITIRATQLLEWKDITDKPLASAKIKYTFAEGEKTTAFIYLENIITKKGKPRQ